MSLTVYQGSDKLFAQAVENSMSISLGISVIVLIISLRGVMSLMKDIFRVLSKVKSYFKKKTYEQKGIQTEPYLCELPAEIFLNSGSGVYHFSGCHHIGVRATSKAACTFCRNRF